MFRAVYYARVSTEKEQQLNALETQVNQLEDFIRNSAGWVKVRGYVEPGQSGTTIEHRPVFKRLINDIEKLNPDKNNEFDTIVVRDDSRAMRNAADWSMFERLLFEKKVSLYFLDERKFYDFSDSNDFFLKGMKSYINELSSRMLSKKVNDVLDYRKQNGIMFGNSRILGYDRVGKTFVINEEQAEYVRYIFEHYAAGDGYRKISRALFDMGCRTVNGTRITNRNIQIIIKNEKYRGILINNRYKKDFRSKKIEKLDERHWYIFDDGFPAIVSVELWEKCNKLMAERVVEVDKAVVGNFMGTRALSSKIICSHCANTYYHVTGGKTPHTLPYWICSKAHTNGRDQCPDSTKVGAADVELIVKQEILKYMSDSRRRVELIRALLEKGLSNKRASEEETKYKNLETRYKKAQAKLKRVRTLYIEDEFTKDEYSEHKAEIESQMASLKEEMDKKPSEIAKLKSKLERIESLMSKYAYASNEDSIDDNMIKNIVQKIVVFDDKLAIYFDNDTVVEREYIRRRGPYGSKF